MPTLHEWERRPPTAYTIVTGYYPETEPKGGKVDCRPLLVTQVLQTQTGKIGVRVCYGTTNLKFPQRANSDLIIQNSTDLDECGLLRATRFVVDPRQQVVMEWKHPNFCPWTRNPSPRIGNLTEELQKEFAWLMMKYL